MSETLLAIFLVTSSAKGSSLVYRWPPHPSSFPRLQRPRPKHDATCIHADNPWRAAYRSSDAVLPCRDYEIDNEEYIWRRPHVTRDRSLSFSHSRSHPTSRRASPSKEHAHKDSFSHAHDGKEGPSLQDEYDQVLGYSAELLASLLSPHRSMCHQKFELVVDGLAFIGHPVCAESGRIWQFRTEKSKSTPRGRGSKKNPPQSQGQSPQVEEKALAPMENNPREKRPESTWLHTFHFVLVLDFPDPSSSASGNVEKYFNIIYEQIVFTITAVLFQEQVLHNFVEIECDTLGALKDEYISRGESFSDYVDEALRVSSIASAMKNLYDAIKDGSIAQLTLHDFPLELQLPPHLDTLLHSDDTIEIDAIDRSDDVPPDSDYGSSTSWGSEMSFAWKLPTLTPWKALLRLDDEGDNRGYEMYMKLRGPDLNVEDRELAEQLIRFLDLATVTLRLADMASLLDWDLESQVFPIVRWLVHRRRAKVVDMVHPGLKTVFAVPQKLPTSLSILNSEFSKTFSHVSIPPLPKLLSQVSMTPGSHFFANVVQTRDMVPIYQDVIHWLLRKDLLIILHLHVRVVATTELKERVRMKRELALARRGRIRARSESITSLIQSSGSKAKPILSRSRDQGRRNSDDRPNPPDNSPVDYWLSMSPKSARRQARRMSPDNTHVLRRRERERSISQDWGIDNSRYTGSASERDEGEDEYDDGEFDDEITATSSVADESKDGGWDDTRQSMISDPGRATALERRWLAAMSDGKDPMIAKRFDQINQYFDGRCSDDEILYKADISRKQLREVLHHYEEYLQTFLHPAS